MNVLVATPMRATTLPVFQTLSTSTFQSLTYPHKERAACVNDIVREPGEPKYLANAKARNMLIDAMLQDHHTHVLWLDVDLVNVPADLIERLAAVSKTDVVAPLVYVEKRNPDAPASIANGGWFYDIGGFVHNGQWTHMWQPQWLTGQRVVGLDSVGCCYLIPADVYRKGARYSASGNRVEHEPFMAEARAQGYRVLVDTTTTVEHAYLPAYGEAFH